jgi:peptidoglycan/LPS O-acetylase OafA/YrhL
MIKGTVKENFEHFGGIAPGFDALRLILAVVVLAWHSVYITLGGSESDTYNEVAHHPLLLPFVRAILPAYFFLGGFLVTGSAFRLRSTPKFLIYRGLRIVPALFVEVVLSAIVLGAVVTTLPLTDYYTHPQFYNYFWNILGYVHFYLPGVFTQNPTHLVNVNLWTLPPDLHGYAIMAGLLFTGIILSRKAYGGLFALTTVFLVIFTAIILMLGADSNLRVPVMSHLMIYSFFLGAFAYIFADRIRLSWGYAALAALGLFFFETPYTILPGIFCAAYLTLCLGFADMRKFPFIKSGDYSYGVYLYGYPIQQTLWMYFPELRGWLPLTLAALPLTLGFAYLSWHFIEEPARGLKKKIPYLKTPPKPPKV